MRPINIWIEADKTISITECEIGMEVNQHFSARITGYLRQRCDEVWMGNMMTVPFVIFGNMDDGTVATIFRGRVCDIALRKEGDFYTVEILAESNTALLDSEKHTRIFQGRSQTYRNVMDKILFYNKGIAVIYAEEMKKSTESAVIQYQETDWQFLKRIAAQLNTVLVVDCTLDKICYYVGLPERKSKQGHCFYEYKVHWYQSNDGKNHQEILVETREWLQLCEPAQIEEAIYYVYAVTGNMKNGELAFSYVLRPLSGFRIEPYSCENCQGASIMGEVRDVKETVVRISLNCENDETFGNAIWFPFSTVYSSPDGTGWYCMPEKGDTIRLCLSGQMSQAYVVSAVHMDHQHELRQNPDEKSIRTRYDKEIRLTPDRILITNHQGMSIVLDDNKGISIVSDKDIHIAAGQGISLKGESVTMEGKQGVTLVEGPNLLMVRDGVKERAVNIEHR